MQSSPASKPSSSSGGCLGSTRPPRRPWRSPLAADIALFTAITVVATWPQAISLTSLPAHHDAMFNVWRLAWIAHALATAPLGLFDANIFHPATGTLAYSDAILFQGLAGAPLILAGLSPVVVCNLLVLASFVFAGTAAAALARDLTGDARAARVAGLVFAFAPFRFDHYFHLELLWSGWLPLLLRYGLRTVTAWRAKDALLCAGSLLGQLLSCLYYGVLAGTLAAGGAAVAIVAGRGAPLRRRLAMVALGGLTLALPLAAYGRPYVAASRIVGERSIEETRAYGAAWRNYLASTGANRLYGWTEARFGGNERQLFPGLVAIALALVACAGPRRRLALALAAAVLASVDLARGMDGVLFPALRLANPALAGLRVPTRFHVFTLLALSSLAALGAASALARASGGRARLVAAALGLALLVEYAAAPVSLVAMDTSAPPVLAQLAREPHAVVAHLPLPRPWALPGDDPRYALWSIHHWRPLINGYSGFYPPAYLRACERAAEPAFRRSIDAVLALGATHIFVHTRAWPEAERAGLEDAVLRDSRLAFATRVDLGGEPVLLVRAGRRP